MMLNLVIKSDDGFWQWLMNMMVNGQQWWGVNDDASLFWATYSWPIVLVHDGSQWQLTHAHICIYCIFVRILQDAVQAQMIRDNSQASFGRLWFNAISTISHDIAGMPPAHHLLSDTHSHPQQPGLLKPAGCNERVGWWNQQPTDLWCELSNAILMICWSDTNHPLIIHPFSTSGASPPDHTREDALGRRVAWQCTWHMSKTLSFPSRKLPHRAGHGTSSCYKQLSIEHPELAIHICTNSILAIGTFL